jgi:flavin reductase (DIM6/NTAB) family NADH-FMN oxidoreductase RutF
VKILPEETSKADLYFRMIECIVPRPIAWVSTLSKAGVPNLAPYSFFTGIHSEPPTLLFCAGNKRSGQPKDSARNALETGEFVVNIGNFAQAVPMVQTSAEYADELSEWEPAGVTPLPSERVKPPRVQGAPVHLECVLHDSYKLMHGAVCSSQIIIGRIVLIHVDESVADGKGGVDPWKLDAIGRLGGQQYCRTNAIFEVPRPKLD